MIHILVLSLLLGFTAMMIWGIYAIAREVWPRTKR